MVPRTADGPVPRVSKLYAGGGGLESAQAQKSAPEALSLGRWIPFWLRFPPGCLDVALDAWDHGKTMYGAHHSVLLLT